MSLNKTLDRLFAEIRREARRNPDFADRLDAVIRAHNSRRDVDEALVEEELSSPARGGGPERSEGEGGVAPIAIPAINPVAVYQRDGAEALADALQDQDRAALIALVAEHNLDPGGEADDLDRDALAAHVVAQAKRRAERDSKLFDY